MSSFRTPVEVAALACLLLISSALLADASRADEIYKWVDAQGKVHFTSTPPPTAGPAQKWEAAPRSSISVVPDLDRPAKTRRKPGHRRTPSATSYATPTSQPALTGSVAGKSRSRWQKSARQHRDRVASLERSIESLEDRMSFPSRARSSLSSARHDARQERRLEQLQQQLQEAEDRLDDFEADAQQKGVPPTWLD